MNTGGYLCRRILVVIQRYFYSVECSVITHMVNKRFQVPSLHFIRILDSQRARRRISRIRERGKVVLSELVIILFKTVLIHQHLTADLNLVNAITREFSEQRNGSYLHHVCSDLVSFHTVAAGSRPRKDIIFVDQ